MAPFLAAITLDLLLAWLILRMVVQARRYRSVPAVPAGSGDEALRPEAFWPVVAVVVPARDEAASIERCVRGLLAQDYPSGRYSLRVVDDGSRDGTGRLAAGAAAGDPRFRLLAAGPVPPDWTGKSHAVAEGVRDLAGAEPPDYLCLVDADTAAEPGLLRAAVAQARGAGLDMLSLGPRQELGGWAERLVMPCGLYLVAASRDVGRLNAPDSTEAAANGQFLLFREAAYRRLGGHAAVRAEICEDTALARRAKGMGLRFALLGAETLIRTRMYRSFGALWAGLSKNVAELGGGPLRTVLVAAAGFALALAVPALAAFCLADLAHRPSAETAAAAGLACAGLLAVLGLHLAGARHFRIPLGYGLLFPIGYGLCLALAVDGARLARRGGVRWKGRTYPAAATAPQETARREPAASSAPECADA